MHVNGKCLGIATLEDMRRWSELASLRGIIVNIVALIASCCRRSGDANTTRGVDTGTVIFQKVNNS